MKNRQQRQIASIVATTEIIQANPKRFPEFRVLAPRLTGHVERLVRLSTDDHITVKAHGGDTDRGKMRFLAAEIRSKHLIPMARTGRKLFRFTPDVERVLVVPPARATPGEIAKASRAMLKAIRPHRKLFIEIGFDPDFVTDCTRMTRELETVVAGRDRYRKARPGIVKSLGEEIAEARKIIDVMNALLLHRLRKDGQLEREWTMASRVGKRIGRPPKPRRKRPPSPS